MGCSDWQHNYMQKVQKCYSREATAMCLEKWWQTTKAFEADQIQSINFLVTRQAWKNVWPSQRCNVSKFATSTIHLWDAA
jgi:hypothetical protein